MRLLAPLLSHTISTFNNNIIIMNKRSLSFHRSNSRGRPSSSSSSTNSMGIASSGTMTIMDLFASFKLTCLYSVLVLLATARFVNFYEPIINSSNSNAEVTTTTLHHHHHHVQPVVVLVNITTTTSAQQTTMISEMAAMPAVAVVEKNDTESTRTGESNPISSSTSSLSSLSNRSNNKKQQHVIVIIHAGPHKTASTTIQQALMRKSKVGTLLADGYETLGQSYFSGCSPPWPSYSKDSIKNHATLAFALQGRCPNNDSNNNDNDANNNTRPPLALLQLSDFMSTAFSRNHSIILSTEEFAQPYTNLSLFHDQLHQFPDINVNPTVILYYRRLLEWLPSIYFEIHKRFQIQSLVFPSFVEWLNMDTLDNYLQLFPWAVKERFTLAGFPLVKILPMQKNSSSSNTTIQFICDHVPGADETCRALLRPAPVNSKRIEKTAFNQGTTLEYDRIMALAIQAGLVSNDENATVAAASKNFTYKVEKHTAVQRLQAALSSRPESYQQKYKTCLPEDVRTRVLELALFFEDKMACGDNCNYGSIMDADSSPTIQQQQEQQEEGEEMKNQLLLRAEFAALLESEKLCSWNAQLLLQEEEWKAFFQSIGH